MNAVTRERALDVLERVRGTRRCVGRLPKREERRAFVRLRSPDRRHRVHSRSRVTIPRSLAARNLVSMVQTRIQIGDVKTNAVVPPAGVNYYCPNQDGPLPPA